MLSVMLAMQKKIEEFADRLAYIFLEDGENESSRITYYELITKSKNIAAYLQQNNLYQKRILLLYPAGIEFLIAFFGCLHAGAIAIPMQHSQDFEKNSQLLKSIAQDADISGILTTASYIDFCKKILEKDIFILDSNQITTTKNYSAVDIKNDDIAYLQYTSGSTSTPKGAMVTYENLYHSVTTLAEIWHYDNQSITFSWAPHSHVYGLVCGLLVPFFHGTPAIFMPTAAFIKQPSRWLKAITRYKVTHSGCPNFGYDLCTHSVEQIELKNLDLTLWKAAINGGEDVKLSTLENFIKKFSACGFDAQHFCPAYGMSELSGAITSSRINKKFTSLQINQNQLKKNNITLTNNKEDARSIVSVGYPLPGLDLKIVNSEDATQLPENQVGEVWVRSKALAKGYWQRPEENILTFKATLTEDESHYFRTGDLGFIHKKELYLVGRLKETIIIYGEKYYPLDLEQVALLAAQSLPTLPICAAFTINEKNKEELVLVQEIKHSATEAEKTLIQTALRRSIMQYFGLEVKHIKLVAAGSIPKTVSGKLQRTKCKEMFIKNHSFTPQKADTSPKQSTESENAFKQVIADLLNVKLSEIDLHISLSEYHFDSINLVQLSEILNRKYHLQITPAQFFEYHTLLEFYNEKILKLTPEKLISEKKHHTNNDVAIIGLACVFPDAPNATIFWNNLINGKNAIREIPPDRWDWQQYTDQTKIHWGGFIENIRAFDADFFNVSPREAELMDPQHRIFLQTVWNAIEDAGYAASKFSEQRIGLFVGMFANDYAEILEKNNITDAYVTTGLSDSMLANRVSYFLNFSGPSEVINTACSSSLVAIHNAVRAIRQEECGIAIVGGVNSILTPTLFVAASQAGMLSEDGKCKTFDKSANGYVRSEGVAAVVLKPLKNALRDQDQIYGVIKGSAVNHGGHVSSVTVPNPNAQADVIVEAIKQANIPIESIQYIEAHGTGTPLGDPVEINGIKKAFSQLAYQYPAGIDCKIGTVKTHIGHLEGAAGIAGLVKVLLSLKNESLPANLHFNELNPYIELGPFSILDKTVPWKINANSPRRAGLSSFGFGGSNAHVIIEEAPAIASKNAASSHYQLFTLSAKTDKALFQRINQLSDWLTATKSLPDLTSISATLNRGREHFAKRCAIIAKSHDELKTLLSQAHKKIVSQNILINTDSINKEKLLPIYQELYPNLIASLNNSQNELEFLKKLRAIANFYIEGFDLDWNKLYTAQHPRISLPGYPFSQDNFWINPISQIIQRTENPIPSEIKSIEENDSNEIQKNFVRLISGILKQDPNKIDLHLSLSEQGFDSIAFNELGVQLEDFYDIEFNPALFFTYHSIDALSDYLLQTYDDKIEKKHNLKKKHEVNSASLISQKVPKKTTAPNNDIAIIGMHGIFPQSKNLIEFWQHLLAQDDLISEIPHDRWDWKQYYSNEKNPQKTNSKWGGFLDNIDLFDASFFNISRTEANFMDPQHRLFMEVVWNAIEDAGIDPFTLKNKSVGVFAGIEFSDYQTLMQERKVQSGHLLTGNVQGMLTNRISYFLNLHGPSEIVDTTCSSAMVAMHRAAKAIQMGECDLAITGSVNINLSPETYIMTTQLGALSPTGRCRTFDKSADGYVKGEGAAAFILKPAAKAGEDRDFIYGIIKGSAVNHGGKAQSLTAPNSLSQSELTIKTFKDANISPATVNFVETHGTGTELGDPIEIEGLKKAFAAWEDTKQKNNYCGLGSVKTVVGHLEPASGTAGVIKVLLAMHYKTLTANLHFQALNPHIMLNHSPFYVVDKNSPWTRLKSDIPLRALISSFGVGGSNAQVILQEDESSLTRHPPDRPYYLITLSAKKEISLKQKISDLANWLSSNDVRLDDLSFTLNTGRAHFAYRAAFVVKNLDDLRNQLMHYQSQSHSEIAHAKEVYQDILKSLQKKLTPALLQEKLMLLANLYLNQFPIDWHELYFNENLMRVPLLPIYPFDRQRYWFNEEPTATPQPIKSHDNDNLETYLKKIFAEQLRISANEISAENTYEVYGIDSMIGAAIVARLEKHFGELPKTLLYEKNTIRALAHYFEKNFSESIHHLTDNVLQEKKPVAEITSTISSNQDVAIIGLNCHFPLSSTPDEFWQNLASGKDCITAIPLDRWNYKDYPVSVGGKTKFYDKGGFIKDVDKFDPLFFNLSPYEASLMDPQERLFLQTAWATLEDAGITRKILKNTVKNNVGVFVGVTYNFYPLYIAEEWQHGNRLPLNIQLYSIANRVSYFLNLNGPSFIVDTACSSSLAAIHLAYESIIRGECEMALAGGVNLSLHPAKYHMLGSFSFMSDEGRCVSFGEGGTGYVPGEGVGAVLLKPLSKAIQDGDRIYGIIKASGMNHGGKTSGYSVPNPNAQAELISKTLQQAKIDPRSISYIEAHGTGTELGDPIELRGLQLAFEQFTPDKQFCAVGSVKSNIGHLESAAGISQLIKVILQMQHNQLAPSLHAEKLNANIKFQDTPFYVQQQLSDWKVSLKRAGISSFGAGGSNVHMIVENYQQTKKPVITPPAYYVLVLSAMSEESLNNYIHNMRNFLFENKNRADFSDWLYSICYTSQVGREAMPMRFVAAGTTAEEILSQLNDNQNDHIFPSEITPLIEAWKQGQEATWEDLYHGQFPDKVSMPTYPFAKRRCWIESTHKKSQNSFKEWFYQTRWEEKSIQQNNQSEGGDWILFGDLGEIDLKTNFNIVDESKLKDSDHKINGILYIANDHPDAYKELFHKLKDLSSFSKPLKFILITQNAQRVTSSDNVNIWQYPLGTLLRIFSSENPTIEIATIDLDNLQKENSASLINEIVNINSQENDVAYRQKKRYVQRLTAYNSTQTDSKWNAPKTALVTGGLGALGFELSRWLAKNGTQYLLLTGRSSLPEINEWTKITEGPDFERIQKIKELENLDIKVVYASADVADKTKMEKIIKECELTWKQPIEGVFHLSGITTDNIPIEQMTDKTLDEVLSAKIQGSLALHELFQAASLKYFVLFSSIAALPYFGIRGLSAYAMANAFMDGLAAFRQSQGLTALSINWSAWSDKGMGFRYNHAAFLDAMGMSAVNPTLGISMMNELLTYPLDNIAILHVDWEKFFKVNLDAKKIDFFKHFNQSKSSNTREKNKKEFSLEESKKIILQVMAKLLNLSPNEIDANTPYQDYGLDSVIGINFSAQLNDYFNDIISPMDLFRYPNVNKLNQFIHAELQSKPKQKSSSLFLSDDELLAEINKMNSDEVSKMIDEELKKLDEF